MQVLAYARGWSDVQARTSEIGQKPSFGGYVCDKVRVFVALPLVELEGTKIQ
jgi:hypothetical protein